MDSAPFHWTEEIPTGSVQQSASSYGWNSGSRVLNIKISGRDMSSSLAAKTIAHIVGYSETLAQSTGRPFDPSSATVQGPYRLSRKLPAKHPAMPMLRATKILSVQGRGLSKTVGGESGGKVASGASGYYGNYEWVYISILFEIPRYPLLPDFYLLRGSLQLIEEYLRYTEWTFDPSLETLARKGETWTYCMSTVFAQQNGFVGDRLLRQPKGVLKILWHDVHQDYVNIGRLIPSNFLKRLSTVNAKAFPQKGYRDQNIASGVVQFRPGTALLLPPKITPHAQCHPAVLYGQISPDYFPRTLDLEIPMLYFDPPTGETTQVDLSAYGGSATQVIYGHNLTPLERPLNGFMFYAAQRGGSGTISGATNATPIVITSVNHLLTTGQSVAVANVGGNAAANNTAANPSWTVTVLTANTFSLNGSVGAGQLAYTSGGTWRVAGVTSVSDNVLLHKYSDFEQLFAAAESL